MRERGRCVCKRAPGGSKRKCGRLFLSHRRLSLKTLALGLGLGMEGEDQMQVMGEIHEPANTARKAIRRDDGGAQGHAQGVVTGNRVETLVEMSPARPGRAWPRRQACGAVVTRSRVLGTENRNRPLLPFICCL